MSAGTLLTIYCLLIIGASLAGGWLPMLLKLTHRRLEIALSFVSGVMLGVALMHLLPHALLEQSEAQAGGHAHVHENGPGQLLDHDLIDPVMLWMIGGFLAMFLIERYFCYHHHEAPAGSGDTGGEADRSVSYDEHGHGHGDADHEQQAAKGAARSPSRHRLTWGAAAIGLTLHTIIGGVALGASVISRTEHGAEAAAGFAAFLMIFLHKPFDALTIATLMHAGAHPGWRVHLVNALFSLAIPAGVGLFLIGMAGAESMPHQWVAGALAFSAGTFLCIALSDLLPELQFHQHDRGKLSLALVAGLVVAWAIGLVEVH